MTPFVRRVLLFLTAAALGIGIALWIRRKQWMHEGFQDATPAQESLIDTTTLLQNRCALLDKQIATFRNFKTPEGAVQPMYATLINDMEAKKKEFGCAELPPSDPSMGSLTALPTVEPPNTTILLPPVT